MSNPQPSNSFSWGDALFLYIERPGQPLSIAGVSVFEGNIPLKECRDLVESRLPLIPRYRQRVAFPPLNLGLPTWQFDPMFDIRNHIRQVTLRNGTEADLKKIASSIISTHLDRQRPLWDITLVRGLQGNRTGMIARLHHCLADGIAGVGILNVLMDTSPVVQPLPRKKPESPAHQPMDAGAALLDGLLKSSLSAVQGALTLHSEAVQMAQGILANSGESLTELLNVLPELAAPADRLPFNVVCHGPQKFGWTELDLSAIKAIKERCGGTVNNVILTVVAAALRRYSELRKVRVKGRSARIMIPVNVRSSRDGANELGNRISFVPVTVPLDIRDPQKLFAYVRRRTEYLKRIRAAELVGFAGGLFSAIPSPILAAIGPVASQLPLSLCNIICTNVPGPQVPLYLLGHKMLAWYPYVPIGGEMGTNWAILSYNGKAYFGFSCDVGAVPDPENLEKFVDASFAELCASARKVTPPVGTESRAQDAPATSRAAEKRERSRMISLGESATVKPKPRKKTAQAAVAQKTAETSKANGEARVAKVTPKPASSEPAAKMAAAEVPAEELAHAVGA